MPNTTLRETAFVGPRKANVVRIYVHINMNRERKVKRRDDFVHLLRQVDRTEIRNVMEKVVMTEMRRARQHLLVKVRQEK